MNGQHLDEDDIWDLLKWFIADSFGSFDDINTENWDSWERIQASSLAKRKCGYDLIIQILYRAHMNFIECHEDQLHPSRHDALAVRDKAAAHPKKEPKIYAPETMAYDLEGKKDQNLALDTCTVVPETQTLEEPGETFVGEKEKDTNNKAARSKTGKLLQTTADLDLMQENIENPWKRPPDRKSNGKSKKRAEASMDDGRKDAHVRSKYPTSDKVYATKGEASSSEGIFGLGKSPTYWSDLKNDEHSLNNGGSHSILRSSGSCSLASIATFACVIR